MSKRYFKLKQGMELFNIIGMVAFAGAIEITRQREFEYNDESMKDVAKRQFSKLNKKEFPYMTDALCVFTQEPQSKLELLLTATFKSIARERGEDESEINLYIFGEIDRAVIYYSDCFQIMIEFNAYNFEGCENVTELAYQLLEEFIWSEITDLKEFLDKIK